jgi:hypothetical protein
MTATTCRSRRPNFSVLQSGEGSPAFDASQAFLTMPFDAMRFHYASAVMAGLARRSIVASGQVERALDGLEKAALGPLARQR